MGFKPTNKNVIIAIIIVILLILLGAYVILRKMGWGDDTRRETKTSYSSYKEFRDDSSSFFPETLPESATDVKYLYIKDGDNYEYALGFKVDSRDLLTLKNHYVEEFDTVRDPEKYLKNETFSNTIINEESIPYIKEFFSDNYGDYELFRYTRNTSRTFKDLQGICYNKDTGHVVIFCASYYLD